ERIWGKADGIDPAGLPRPCRGVWRTTPPPSAPVVPKLLQRRPNAPNVGQGRADPASRPGRRPDVSRASLGWAAPSIYPSVSFRQGQQLITGSLVDYAIPHADNVPPLISHCVPSKTNPLGVKGGSETGNVGAPAAIINAIIDALSPFNVTDLPLPATPERIWRAIRRP